MIVEEKTPLPPADNTVQEFKTAAIHSTQVCEDPLERFRVKLSGTGVENEDHSAPLRGKVGEPVQVEFDLLWETAGAIPYKWRLTPRYELPCQISGVVRIGNETFKCEDPGQRDHSWGTRDHSWGTRDWWAIDWM
jgi:hypothetical protein